MTSTTLLVRLRRPMAVWLALWLAALGALAPSISHALARSSDAVPGAEVCSVRGVLWVVPPVVDTAAALERNDAQPQPEPASVAALDHCPFCLLGAQGIAPLASSVLRFAAPPAGLVPVSDEACSRPCHFNLGAPARGPPPNSLQRD